MLPSYKTNGVNMLEIIDLKPVTMTRIHFLNENPEALEVDTVLSFVFIRSQNVEV